MKSPSSPSTAVVPGRARLFPFVSAVLRLQPALSLLTTVAVCTCSAQTDGLRSFRCTPPQLWSSNFGAPPLLPFLGDVDSDGYDDLICLMTPGEGTLEVSFNGGAKALKTRRVLDNFGTDGIAVASGSFTHAGKTDVLALFGDGSLRLAYGFNQERGRYAGNDVAGKLPSFATPVGMAAGDFDGDGRDEAAVVDAKGRTWLVDHRSAGEADVIPAGGLGSRPGRIAAGDMDGDGRAEIVFQDREGAVWSQRLRGWRLGRRSLLMRAAPGAQVACAFLDDNETPEVVVGRRVLWNGSGPLTLWNQVSQAGPGLIFPGHMRGDGRHDLVLFKRNGDVAERRQPGQEPYSHHDVYILYTYREGDPDPSNSGMTAEEKALHGLDPLNRDTSGDGLLDVWKVRAVRGLDLPRLGVHPLRKNVICVIQPIDFDESEMVRLREEIDQVKSYFAALSVKNLDGSYGINFVPILRENLPPEDVGRGWRDLSRENCPPEHEGITHWMVVYKGGGGQSSMMGTAGSCGNSPFYATFIHEFGHQLGLDHNGFWDSWSPTYTSLMNYTYNYSFEGSRDRIHYSKGNLDRLILDPTDLSEVTPIRKQYLEFLSRPPYSYAMQERGDDVMIDWNRNAVFGEQSVRASINSSYGMSAGLRHTVDTTVAAPFLLSHNDRELLLIYVRAGGDGGEEGDNPVVVRRYLGDKRWSDADTVAGIGATGDPVAVSDGSMVRVCFPTADGVVLQTLRIDDAVEPAGHAEMLPDSLGAEVTLVNFQGRLLALYFKGPEAEVTARWKTDVDWSSSQGLGFTSTFPVGAVVDTVSGELVIGCGQEKDPENTSSWQIRRFSMGPDGTLIETGREWVGGKSIVRGHFRPVLIFDTSSDAGPRGRLFFLAASVKEADGASGIWYCQQIADKSLHDGWIIRRYYDEWTRSRSTPAAAWFGDDIVMGYRWAGDSPAYGDGQIHIGYAGMGIEPGLMGDFDDVGFISEIGLSHSILEMAVGDTGGRSRNAQRKAHPVQ